MSSERRLDEVMRDESLIANQDDPQSDPFEPFRDIPPSDGNILTIRALVVGCLCGALINCSNLYLGLKAGWTASANIVGSIVGFAALKNRRHFGPQENNIVQTAATAAGGLSNVFISAIPALYQLGLLRSPSADFGSLVAVATVGGYFGLLSAAPLRNLFISQVAREMHLIFPSSSATAITIRGMHMAASGDAGGRTRMRALLYSFSFALILRVISQYAIGIFWDWHFFSWVASSGIFVNAAMGLESWGWYIEWTPAFVGSGMLVGPNVAASFLLGSIIAWGIIGPFLVSHGLAFGKESASADGLVSYASLSTEFANSNHPSPRYWLLWPGVACMVAVAFAELLCQWQVIWVAVRGLYRTLKSMRKQQYSYIILEEEKESSSEGIRTWMWLPGLIVTIVLTCIVMSSQFGMAITETLLALALAFFLSLLAIHANGTTDTTPLTSLTKVTQVVLGVSTQGSLNIENVQRLNLLGGALTNMGANQACDLMGDFRVGFLLGTSPRVQYAAQMIGTLVAALVSPAMFLVFATAYPCILSTDDSAEGNAASRCEFSAPAVSAWRAVAIAVTGPESAIPHSSLVFSIAMAGVASLMIFFKHFVWVGRWKRVQVYQPNMMVVALAFTLPSTHYGTAMLIGAFVAQYWSKNHPDGFEKYGYAVAAGFMAGEGIGGTLNAILAGIGLDGERFGTSVGCPGQRC